jgi:hypothetical protein
LGIEYRVGDVATLGRIGDFNSVFAAFLLHYAPSPEDLLRMCRTISANLLPGGSFVTFVENPNCPVYDGIKYDVSVVAQGPVVDGARITRTHYENGGPVFSFDHCHYEQGTYERVLGEAGLEQVRWLPFVKASDADLGYPNGYWDDFVSGGSITVLTCRKGN